MNFKKLFSAVLASAVLVGTVNFPCLAATQNEYTVNGLEILSEDFKPLKSIAYSEPVAVHASITKNTYSDTAAVTAVASYNANGSLAELKAFRGSGFSAGQTAGIYTTFNALANGSIKAFVWESLNSAKPLSNSVKKDFADFLTPISYGDTTDRIRIRGYVAAVADGKAKIEIDQRYDSDVCAWQISSGTVYADTNGFNLSVGTSAELMLGGYPASNKILAVNENYGSAENIMLASVRNEYYEINGITVSKADGSAVTELKKGDSVYGGAYFTRTDATTYKEPYLSLELRGGDNTLIDSVIVNTDEMNYNQMIYSSFMFTVPENFENCFILACVYDGADCATALSSQTKKSLADFSGIDITKNTIKIRGRFAEKKVSSVVFGVTEALVPVNGVKRWTTDFKDYVSETCTIQIPSYCTVNIDELLGYEALLEVEISDGKIILINAEKIDSDYSDVVDESEILTTAPAADYTQALNVLSSLDIADNTDIDKQFTRGMLAELLCKISGYADYAATNADTAKFTDVESGTVLNGWCVAADKLGFVPGYAGGTFKPNKAMKYADILTAILNCLGYTDETNVTAKAASIGLCTGVSAADDNALTKGTALVLIYNALEIPMVEKSGTTYASLGVLPLNMMNIVKFEGIIEATPVSDESIIPGKVKVKYERQITAVKDSLTAQKYYMGIAEEKANPSDVYGGSTSGNAGNNYYKYKTATINADSRIKSAAESYLDYNVVMYVKNADSANATLTAVYPTDGKNKSVSFRAKDLNMSYSATNYRADYNGFVTGTIGVYTDKETEETEKYDIEISKVYVNGREQDLDGTTIDDVAKRKAILDKYLDDTETTEIKLLNNTLSDVYNIAYITANIDVVVETINEKTTTIVGKSSDIASRLYPKVIFDEDEYSGRFSFVKDGKPAAFSDIKEDDVLSIAGYINSNKELEYGVVTITSERAEGLVSSYDTEGNTITVGGKTYNCNNFIYGHLGMVGSSGIKLGDEVSLYVNALGYVVDIDRTYSARNLSYGFATKIVKSTGVEGTWQIRILTTDGTWSTYDFASKVNFEGNGATTVSNLTDWDMATKLGATVAGTTLVKNAVIAYETNSSNEINKVYVNATTNTEDTFNYAHIYGKEYIESTGAFDGVYLNDDTVIFSYKTGVYLTDVIDEDDIVVAKKDSLINRNAYTATAYGLDDDYYAKVVCGEGLVGEIALNGDFFVISGKTITLDADGNTGYELTGYVNGEKTTVFVDAADTSVFDVDYSSGRTPTFTTYTSPSSLAKGDVIIYNTINGKTDTVYRLVQASALKDNSSRNGLKYTIDGNIKLAEFEAAGNTYSFYCGFAYNKNGSNLKLADSADGTTAVNVFASSDVAGATVGLFSSKVKVQSATAGDVQYDHTGDGYGDMVFVRAVNDIIMEDIVIYKSAKAPEIQQPDPKPEVNVQYGFATKVVRSTGVEDKWQIRMLTTDGEWKTFDFASNVSFDGNSAEYVISPDFDMKSKMRANIASGETVLKNGIIAYDTNTDGDINKIYVTVSATPGDVFNCIDINDKAYTIEMLGGTCLSDDTAIFSYTPGIDFSNIIAEKDIEVVKKSELVTGKRYTATAYGLDNNYYATAVFGEGLVGEIDLNGDFFVISNIAITTNGRYELTGYVSGEETKIIVDKTDADIFDISAAGYIAYKTPVYDEVISIEDLEKGDVILHSTINGKTNKIYKLLDASALYDETQIGRLKYTIDGNIKLAEFEVGGNYYCFYYGFAYDRSRNTLILSDNDYFAINLMAKADIPAATVDLFSSKVKVQSATASDVQYDPTGDGYGDTVFIRTLNDTIVEDVVIFKFNN